jgi:hypothetical protein
VKSNPNWQALKVDILLDFEIDEKSYSILRMGEQIALFDANAELVWLARGITSSVAPRVAELLSFGLKLQDRNDKPVTPPPAFCFLPYYVDQDQGWVKSWNSFAGLGQFSNVKQDLVYFHAGLRPNEYYEAKGEKIIADRARDELRIELNALTKAKARIQAGRAEVKFDIRPDLFADKIEQLLIQCNSFKEQQAAAQKRVGDLYSERAVFEDQIRVVEEALIELDSDFTFLRSLPDVDVICPTCGTLHENNFVNKFELISDTDSCKRFLIDAKVKLTDINRAIDQAKANFKQLDAQILKITTLRSPTYAAPQKLWEVGNE